MFGALVDPNGVSWLERRSIRRFRAPSKLSSLGKTNGSGNLAAEVRHDAVGREIFQKGFTFRRLSLT